MFRHSYGTLGQALDQSLGCVDILVKFREAVGFDGSQTWAQHLESLQKDSRVAAMACEREASITMQLWLSEQRNCTIHWCSTHSVKALLAMAQWKEALVEETTRRIMDKFLQCNERLVAWFA
jgi:hypothetical protein